MPLQKKYAKHSANKAVLDAARELGVIDFSVHNENGKMVLNGTVYSHKEEQAILDKIKEIGGKKSKDIIANIRIQK